METGHDDSSSVVTQAATPGTPRRSRGWWETRSARWALAGAAVLIFAFVIAGAAYIVGYQRGQGANQMAESAEGTRWTCSMHPSVDLPKAGKCPICFMALIPKEKSQGSGHPRELVMSAEGAALAEVQTTRVVRRVVTNEVRMVGKVDYDETKLAYITSWVPGRLDRLFIDYTGVRVRKGDHLVSMYSPDLLVAQRELIQVWNNLQRAGDTRNRDFLQRTLTSTEEKLRLLGLSNAQIDAIKVRGTVEDHITIHADIDGVVVHKNATEGMYVQTGSQIYTIADLSQVWVFMDAYESDLPWIRYGQEVEFRTETYPGEIFKGRVAFIDPMLNEKTRTARVRVNVPNADRRLKPGMFVRAKVAAKLSEGGQVVDQGLAGKWVSPHHPEVVRDGPGKCPICGIDLVPAEELGFVSSQEETPAPIVIPASAPLITGRRAVVYVKVPDTKQPTFQGRDIVLGQRAGDYYIVRYGLAEGEQVVIHGNFKIDSALQIAGQPSMMNPVGGSSGTGHHHGQGEHPGHSAETGMALKTSPLEIPAAFRSEVTPAWTGYLKASEALARDDHNATREGLQQLLKTITSVPFEAWLNETARSRWRTTVDAIVFAVVDALDATTIEQLRVKFQPLSQAMSSLGNEFGHALSQPVYEFDCDMAFNNKGAHWLQLGEKARNPYFGRQMLACGQLSKTLYPQGPLEVPAQFRIQLSTLYRAYLELQSALAGDDLNRSRRAAGKLHEALLQVDNAQLESRAKNAWLVARRELETELPVDHIDGMSIDTLRKRFEPISETMLGVVDNFGHSLGQPMQKAFCPMAFDSKGANWLQLGENIANPYFGARMLKCGSIKRSFAPDTESQKEGRDDG